MDHAALVLIAGVGLLAVGLRVIGPRIVERVARAVSFRCPACDKKTIELDLEHYPGGLDAETGTQVFVCAACRAEFRRSAADHGPLIPRAAWEAGARDPLPKAHARDRHRVE